MFNKNNNSTHKIFICDENYYVKKYEQYIGEELTIWIKKHNQQSTINNQTKILLNITKNIFLIENPNAKAAFLYEIQKKLQQINILTKEHWLSKAYKIPASILEMITKYQYIKKINNTINNKINLNILENKLKAYANELYKKYTYGQSIKKAIKNINDSKISFLIPNKPTYSYENNHAWYIYYQHNIIEAQKIILKTGQKIIFSLSLRSMCVNPVYKEQDANINNICQKIINLIKTINNAPIILIIDTNKTSDYIFIISILKNLAQNNSVNIDNKIGITIQAYKKNCLEILDSVINICTATKKKIIIRLVKGGFWHHEIYEAKKKYCCPSVFTKKINTEISYLACVKKLAELQDKIIPYFATNNITTIQGIKKLLKKNLYEFHYIPNILNKKKIKEIVGSNAECTPHIIIGNHNNTIPLLTHMLLNTGEQINKHHKTTINHTLCNANNFIFNQNLQIKHPTSQKEEIFTVINAKEIKYLIIQTIKQNSTLYQNITNPKEKLNKLIQSITINSQDIITTAITEQKKTKNTIIKEILYTIKHLSLYETFWSNKNTTTNNKVFLCIEFESPQIKNLIINTTLALLTGHPVIIISKPNHSLICDKIIKILTTIFCKKTLLHISTNNEHEIKKFCLNSSLLAIINHSNKSKIVADIAKKFVNKKNKPVINSPKTKEVVVFLDQSISFWEICEHIINQSFVYFTQNYSISLLCVHENIYKKTLFALIAAVDCLNINNINNLKHSADFLTEYEHDVCKKHYKKMMHKTIYQNLIMQNKTMFPPTIYSVNNILYLKDNPIGPVLGLMKYTNKDLPKLLYKIEKIDNNHIVEIYTRITNLIKISQKKIKKLNIYFNKTADSNLNKTNKKTIKKTINEFTTHNTKIKKIKKLPEFYSIL